MAEMIMIDWSEGSSFGETDFLVLDVEVGIEGLEETVSQDEGFSELRRQVESHNANNARGFASLVDFKDVVFAL